jgi:L-amino acid N-acyltransferase YncA
MEIAVIPLRPEDWPEVERIYSEGIATGQATFETAPPTWEAWNASHLDAPRLVACDEARVVGWAALSPVSSRCVYGGVAEVSVYVSTASRRRGIGMLLLAHLIRESEGRGIWTLQAGIFPENGASVAIHRKAGFTEVGRRERIGKLQGRWRDVLLLERRSPIAGVD